MQNLDLPRQALRLLLGNRSLFFLAFFPGILTLALTSFVIFLLWQFWLIDLTAWLSYPLLIIMFPILWIIIGNLALAPVEDQIVDRVQLSLWQEVRIPSRDFMLARLGQELGQSIFISVFFVFLLIFTLIPGMALLSYVFAAWATSWNFLVTIYNRKHVSRSDKLRVFFKNIVGNTILGMFLNLLLFIPILNVWLLGYALILATLLEMKRNSRATIS
jgi:hypothetical protein